MKNILTFLSILLLPASVICQTNTAVNDATLKLNPENPNYFSYKNKPTILLTSGEHYGAVLNADFNYELYLNELKKNGFNYTRIFIGPYSELGFNNFGISNNTLNPKPDKYLTPWSFNNVSRKYDLTQWNSNFFKRLKAFLNAAAQNDIIVEITLFSSYYTNVNWQNSAFYYKNNINNIDTALKYSRSNTINNGILMKLQEQYVRKIVRETNEFANIFFEIQNEPYADQPNIATYLNESDSILYPNSWQKRVEIATYASSKWQSQIASIITDEENTLPNKHLIAQNISNFQFALNAPNSNISIYNFHYAHPHAVLQNLDLLKAIALDETGFMPQNDFIYRSQAWKFILAGGALYNNLDYSFIVGKEDGSHVIDDNTPGYGNKAFRTQLSVLKQFIEQFDYIKMKADNSILLNNSENKSEVYILAQSGKQYAVYICSESPVSLKLSVPPGKYKVEWINTINGKVEQSVISESKNNMLQLSSPAFASDIALRILVQ